jgi:hypothetical protein
VNILQFMDSLARHGWFKRSLIHGDTWRRWRVLLAGLYHLPMDARMQADFFRFTGRTKVPDSPFDECWIAVGRGGGKSLLAAMICTYIAVYGEHGELTMGESAVCLLLAADKAQSQVCLRYVFSFFDVVPALKKLELSRTQESLTLRSGITIEVVANNQASLRGRTYLCVICDEIAFWSFEGVNQAEEVINAIRPRMTPGAKLICISSPFASRGLLFDMHEAHFGRDDEEVLFWFADSHSMNPLLSEKKIAKQIAADPLRMRAEYGFGFRSLRGGAYTREAIEAVIVPGRREILPDPQRRYVAFCDMAGGTGQDSATLAIAHVADGVIVLDLLREAAPPFNPAATVAEFSKDLRRYQISEIIGDRFGGGTFASMFADNGIRYTPSEKNKSQIYHDFTPLLNARKVELLDHPKLKSQLLDLEVRIGTSKSQPTIDHARSGHDDSANSCCGVVVLLVGADSWQLGVMEYYTNPAKAEIALAAKQAEAGLRPAANTWKVDAAPACINPECRSESVQKLPGLTEYRCQICATQWPIPGALKRSRDPFGGEYQGSGGPVSSSPWVRSMENYKRSRQGG